MDNELISLAERVTREASTLRPLVKKLDLLANSAESGETADYIRNLVESFKLRNPPQ